MGLREFSVLGALFSAETDQYQMQPAKRTAPQYVFYEQWTDVC